MGDSGTVLVTGAAGFIGSSLCVRLASEGRSVVAVDNFDPYYSRIEKEVNVNRLRAAGADFRELDIRNHAELASVVDVAEPSVIVHLAAKAGVRNSVKFPRQYFESNLLGTQNVLDACRDLGVGRLVLASTSSVYGNTKILPFEETDSCVEPLHPYAASKRAAELLASTYARLYGLEVTVFRFFTVYGPHGRPDMMPRLLLSNLTHGTPVNLFEGDMARDWTHVDDIVSGLVLGVDKPVGFEIVNLGRGEPVRLADFISTLEEVSGLKTSLTMASRPSSEMLSTHANTSKLGDMFEFQPATTVHEGVKSLWDWWESEGQHV